MLATDKASARRRAVSARPQSPIATPSEFIWRFKNLAARRPRIQIVIYARVSGRAQRLKSLERQIAHARREVEAAGGVVVGVFYEVVSGWIDDPKGRPELIAAVQHAAKVGAVVVATSVSRLVRSADYNSVTNQDAIPTIFEMLSIIRLIRTVSDKVKLATILDPDAPPSEVRDFESNRGGKRGGRPAKRDGGRTKARYEELHDQFFDFYLRSGSKKEAAARVGIPRSTGRAWLKKMGVADFCPEEWSHWQQTP